MKKKKILIVNYGGTIVMIVDEKTKSVVAAKNIKEILEQLPNLDKIADIEMTSLANKDSTNITPDDWTRLAMFIHNKHDQYDGFIITHGTNTMTYTASALALALGEGLKKPIVFTGSQLPIMVYGSDARFNFENAVKTCVTAAEKNIAEVMITFSDLILRGARSSKISEASFRAFRSPAFPALGEITANGIIFNFQAKKADPKKEFKLNPHFNTDIISVDLTPGQRPSIIEELVLSGKCKGVILKSHGAGSVPTDGAFSFLPLIERVIHQYKVPVIIATKFLGGNAYKEINDECAVLALKSGAVSAIDMTDSMTEVKLMWLLAQGTKSLEELGKAIQHDYVGEVTEINKK